MTPFTLINFFSISEQLVVSKWIANLDSTIILWKKYLLAEESIWVNICFNSTNKKKTFLQDFYNDNNKSISNIYVKLHESVLNS